MRRLTLPLLLVLLAVIAALVTCEPTPVDNQREPAGEAHASAVTPDRAERNRVAVAEQPASSSPARDTDTEDNGPEPWRIRIVGPHGDPLSGVIVDAFALKPTDDGEFIEDQIARRATNSEGIAYAAALPAGMTGVVRCNWLGMLTAPYERETLLRVEGALRVTVAPVDASTGRAVDADIVLVQRDFPHERGEIETTLAREGALRVLAAAPLQAGGHASLTFRVTPTAGYLTGHGVWVSEELSALAEELHISAPIRREVQLRARVSDDDGSAVAGARLRGVLRNGVAIHFLAAETGADGVLVVRGLSFFRGDRFAVVAGTDERWAQSETFLLTDPDQEFDLPIRLPETSPEASWRPPENEDFYGPGCGRRGGNWLGEDDDAVLRVLALTRRGERAGVEVVVVTSGQPPDRRWRVDTGADGLALFPRLPPGQFDIIVSDPGITASHTRIDLGPGEQRHLTLREPAGRPRTIRVLDNDGAAIPFARLSLSREVHEIGTVRVAHLVDGVQHLPIVTDALGVLRLTNAPPGELRVVARYGSRSSEATSEASEIVIRLPER